MPEDHDGSAVATANCPPTLPRRLVYGIKSASWFRAVADVSVMLVQQVASTGISAITSILTARGLGPHNLGLVALAQSVVGISTTLSGLGLNQTTIRFASREIAAGRTESGFAVFRWAFRHRMFVVLLVTGIAFALAPYLANNVWHQPELTMLIRVALPLSIIANLAAVPDVYFQAIRKFAVNAGVRIGESIISLLGIVWLWFFSWWTPYAAVLVSMAATATGAMLFMVMVPMKALFSRAETAALISHPAGFFKAPEFAEAPESDLPTESAGRFAFLVMLSSLLVMATLRADYIFLGMYRPVAEAGIYSIGMQLSLPLGFLLGALNSALFPRVASKQTRSSLRRLAVQATKMSLLAFAGAMVYTIVMPRLAPVLFGNAFRASMWVGHLLCFRMCLAILACPLGVAGYALGLARHYVFLNAIQFAVVVLIDWLFVPSYGMFAPCFALIANDLINLIAISVLVGLKMRK